MAGRGLYLVGKSAAYSTFQHAIDALIFDQGSTPFTTEQRIISVEAGQYPGFRLLEGGLSPTATYPLTIGSISGVDTVVTGQIDKGANWTGVTIDSTDYVQLDNLIVRDFQRGIVVYNSTRPVVKDCVVRENSVVGTFLSTCTDALVYGCSMSESDVLLTLSLCQHPLIIHNTLANYKNGRHCIYVDPWRNENSIPLYVWDNIHELLNNVIYSSTGSPLVFPARFERIFNENDGNYFFSSNGTIAEVREDVDGVLDTTHIKDMVEWRLATGGDSNSKFGDPHFVLDTVALAPTPRLTVDVNSPAGLSGVELVGDPDGRLPPWVDDSIFSIDALRNFRRSPPTAGAVEMNPGDDFDFFSFYIDTSSIDTSDPAQASGVTGVDRAVRQLQASMECWYPQIRRGFFYHRDAKYYLYAQKRGITLKEATWSQFELSEPLTDVTVMFGEEEAEFALRGTTLWVSHANTGVGDEIDGHIHIEGTGQVWDSSIAGFQQYQSVLDLLPRDGDRVFFLPTVPEDGAPIVVTDDLVRRTDPRSIVPYEFSTQYDPDLELTELRFQGAENKFQNADFSYPLTSVYATTGAPAGWEVDTSLATVPQVVTSVAGVEPYVGDRLLYYTSTGAASIVAQEVRRSSLQQDMVLSFYLNDTSAGGLSLTVESLDEDRSIITSSYVSFDPPGTTDAWKRYYSFLPASPDSTFDDHGAIADTSLTDILLYGPGPEQPTYLRISLESTEAATGYLDGMMISEGSMLKRFARMPYGDGMTIEYESSDGMIYRATDLSISPILNPQHTGFLSIRPVPASQFDTSAASDATTLSDYRWSVGRQTYLPWAKLEGPDKLVHVINDGKFGYTAQPLVKEINSSTDIALPARITISPPIMVVHQNSLVGFSVTVEDFLGNPYAHESVALQIYDKEGRFPGYIGVREMSVASIFGHRVDVVSDPSGSVGGNVIAPGQEYVRYAGNAPDGGSNWIPTRYEVNFEGQGNVVVRHANDGSRLTTIGTETSEYVIFGGLGTYSMSPIQRVPRFGSVKVWVDDTSSYDQPLEESLVPDLSPHQFFVDYTRNEVFAHSSIRADAKISYVPLLAWRDAAFPRRIYFDDTLISTMTSDIVVDYDARVYLRAQVSVPGSDSVLWSEAPVILRNPQY